MIRIATAFVFFSGAAFAQEGVQPDATLDFERSVMEVIVNNPEVVLIALEKLQEKRKALEHQEQEAKLLDVSEELFPSEKIQLVKFIDYRCSYCARSAEIVSSFSSELQSRVRYVELPILGAESAEIASVALAVKAHAGETEYRRFHAAVFERVGRISGRIPALRLAEELGHPRSEIDALSRSDQVTREITENRQLARKIGITGTPAFVRRWELHEGMMQIEDMKAILDQKETTQ